MTTESLIGVHHDMSSTEYRAIDAAHYTALKLFAKTPAHVIEYLLRPPAETPAMRLGHACHAAILEPTAFANAYAVAPKCDGRTKEGKATWAAFEASTKPGAILLKSNEGEAVAAMRDAAWANPLLAEMLGGEGRNEMSIVWKDKETGVLCKSRIDRIKRFRDYNAVADVKTCRSADLWRFLGDAAKMLYHLQAGMYLE